MLIYTLVVIIIRNNGVDSGSRLHIMQGGGDLFLHFWSHNIKGHNSVSPVSVLTTENTRYASICMIVTLIDRHRQTEMKLLTCVHGKIFSSGAEVICEPSLSQADGSYGFMALRYYALNEPKIQIYWMMMDNKQLQPVKFNMMFQTNDNLTGRFCHIRLHGTAKQSSLRGILSHLCP